MKFAQVTRSPECNAKPATWDPELELKHESVGGSTSGASHGAGSGNTSAASRLVLMLSKHVDDLKIAGQEHRVE